MKKALLLSILASGVLFAQESIQPDRMKNMQDMEAAMSVIQKGFLFAPYSIVSLHYIGLCGGRPCCGI